MYLRYMTDKSGLELITPGNLAQRFYRRIKSFLYQLVQDKVTFLKIHDFILYGFLEKAERPGEFDTQQTGFSPCRPIITGEDKSSDLCHSDAACLS